jgi:signal transduction histidine kinase/ActR/RegA family two-component response regulator
MPGDVQVSPATPPSHEAVLAQRVRDEQTTLLYSRVQPTTLTGVAFALVVVFGLLPYVSPWVVWGWFVLRCVVSGARLLLSDRFFRTEAEGHPAWRAGFLGVLALDGFVWALLVLWLAPSDTLYVMVLAITALVGLASIGVFVLQASWHASAVFLLTMLVPPAVFLLLHGSRTGLFSGIGLLMFVGLLLVEARRAEARIRELLELRFTTDRIANERAQALLLAQRQSSVKSQFLATMSHEMRTPLHGILGLTRMLHSEQNAHVGEQLTLIERAGEHLLTLINDILDFSKLEAGQVRLSSQVFDLAALIDEVVSLSVPSAAQSGLGLQARLNMPRPCLVRGDPSRLRQVLHNLVGNGIKFTEAGAVTVVARHRGARARIAVHDTGVGVSAEDLPRIFDAFHQADSSFTRRFAGTGLGLTIARELARAMGGDLVCTSKEGRGSCFTLTLDLPVAQAEAVHPVASERPTIAEGARVLLAEDNPVNALVAEAALKKMGLQVEIVGDGAQALASFRRERPDLVLLDCQMPGVDGFEAARGIRAHEIEQGMTRTPVIALTANALEGDRELSLAAGMDDHLAKPFRDEDLRAVLARLMRAA